MNREEIIRLRLANQRLSVPGFDKPEDAVAHFGAIQAQDYGMALWAVALRTKSLEKSAVENCIISGEMVRTHILRPTWHWVHRADLRWMLELSAPYVKKITHYNDKKEGLSSELFLKVWKIIEHQFRDADNLSKEDIMAGLAEQHIEVSNLLATQILIRAELEMLLCNGIKKNTYSLFEKKIPVGEALTQAEAIEKLARRYYFSRGPATLKDFAWWSGMSLSDAKAGISAMGNDLLHFDLEGLRYYYFEPQNTIPNIPVSDLLPCFDEYTVGYSEGRNIVLPTGLDSSETGNGIFKPIVMVENEIVGTWRKIKKNPFVEISAFSNQKSLSRKNTEELLGRFNRFNI
ncbi:MAG: winged helix DNA-binding domain-containing protein [Spirosomataceae bacterium]